MKHHVKKGFRTPSTEGQMLALMYEWCMKKTQELIYDDVEKTLTLYDTFYEAVIWIEDNYDINEEMRKSGIQL